MSGPWPRPSSPSSSASASSRPWRRNVQPPARTRKFLTVPRGREGRDQGGQGRRRDLARAAGECRAEGHRCALDAEVRQGPPVARRQAGIDIAIPSFGYKSNLAICRRYGFIRRGKVTLSRASTDACCAMWLPTTTPPPTSGPTRHTAAALTKRGSGRSGASAASIARSPRVSRCPHVPSGQRCQVHRPHPHRARVRPPEGPDGAVRPHHRHRLCRDEDHARPPRLQHRQPRRPRTTDRHRITVPGDPAFLP